MLPPACPGVSTAPESPSEADGKRVGGASRFPFAHRRQACYDECVTTNTITVRLRRPKREIEAKAKPNVNAWVNNLIEQALGPRKPDWNEHFDRATSGRRFRYTSDEVRRADR